MSRHPDTAISELRGIVQGRVIAPDDSDYDEARELFYGGMDHRPAAIVRVADDKDVSSVVAFARDTETMLAVRSGGHSIPGHSVWDGSIVLDLKDMRALDLDLEGRTAWAEAGFTTGELTTATTKHGLVVGFGDSGSVGIGGITLGGGVGYLVRKHGLTIDDLLGADIVTADGEIHRVDADSEPDLFWAIRGGGGNFGVATRFRYQLHPVETVVGGMLILPATADAIAGFVAASEAAPEELSAIANVMVAPPMPFLPQETHGKLVIMGTLVHAGELEDGEHAVAPFRALAEPLADMVKPMPYPEIYPPEDGSYHPIGYARTMFVDHIDRDIAGTIVEQLQASTAMMAAVQLRVLGGAMARVPTDETAFAHRRSKIMVNVAALFERIEELETHEPWVDGLAGTLHQGDDGAYVGFLGNEGEERIRAAYPDATWERLRTIKARYDPRNLFRLNQNIPPSETFT
jgi:FAD/FMN-containing dehydrogenase